MRVLAVLLVAVTVLVLLPTDRAQEQAVLSADPSQDSGEAEASSRRREKSTRDTSRSDVENLTTFALIDYLQRKGYEIDASNANYEDLLEFALSIDDRALEELSSNIELVSSDEEQDTANDSDVEKIEQAVGQGTVCLQLYYPTQFSRPFTFRSSE